MQVGPIGSSRLRPAPSRPQAESSNDSLDRWAPTGEVAVAHPKPNFAPAAGIDSITRELHKQWAARMRGQEKCTVAILCEREWRPEEEHDEVLDIADAIMDAGGLPRLVYLGGGSLEQQMQGASALAIPGGRDVDPAKYGHTLGPNMDPNEPDPAFDDFEIAAIQRAFQNGMPMLGHCRGTQIMNVAGGGTLTQNIPTDHKTPPGWGSKYGTPVDHRPEAARETYAARVFPGHLLYIEDFARLHSLVGSLESVNSIHHQCIDSLSPLLMPVAFALDGVVEGVERKGMPWQAGYQFHPEALRYSDSRYQQIYDQLVSDGAAYAQGRLGQR